MNIAGKTAALSAFNVLVRSLAIGRELVIAWVFGVSAGVDAYTAALLIQTVVTSVVISSYSASVLPIYLKVLSADGGEQAGQLLAHIVRSSLRVLVLVSLALAVVGYPLLGLIFGSLAHPAVTAAHHILIILLPTVLCSGIASILSAVLTANTRFYAPVLFSLTTPIATVVSILACKNYMGVLSIALGISIGQAIEMSLLLGYVRKLKLLPVLASGKPFHLRTVYEQVVQMAVGAAILSATGFVDNKMAANTGPGGLALLSYGGRIVLALQGVLYTALATITFPSLSKLCAQERWTDARSTVMRYAAAICSLTCFGAILFWLCSEWLVRVLYVRGNFTAADAQIVTTIQRMYLLQCPFYLCSVVFVRTISALHRNWILAVGAIIGASVNVCGNLYLVRRIGLAGVPVTAFLMNFTSACFLFCVVTTLLKRRIAAPSKMP